jgi:S1-C subfamily serine protease
VISTGAPNGQANPITYGQLTGYSTVTLTNTPVTASNVTFEVVVHDAYINIGSSAGPLLDANLNVIGVNYTEATTSALWKK